MATTWGNVEAEVKRLLEISLLICWAAVLKTPPRKPIMAKGDGQPQDDAQTAPQVVDHALGDEHLHQVARCIPMAGHPIRASPAASMTKIRKIKHTGE